jgi:hypothetical protein
MIELLSIYTSVGSLSLDEVDPDVPALAPATVVAFLCHIAVGQIVRVRYLSIENLSKHMYE